MKSLLRVIALSAIALSILVVPTHAQAPAPPTGLNQQVSGPNVSIFWNASAGAVAYIVQAGTASGASNLFNASVGNITGAQGSLPPGTYFWRVIAVGPSGALSAPSAESQFTIGNVGTCVPPGPPQSFTSSVSGPVVSLLWAPPVSGTAPFTFIIEAGSGSGQANLAVLPTGSSATQFATAAPSGTYFIRLRAQNACGVSGVSTEQVVTVGGAPPPPTGNCTYAVSPSQINAPAAGGPIQVNVAAPGGCRWQLASDVFIVPASATSGAGSTTVPYNVQPTAVSRTGTVTIAAIDPGPVTAAQVTVQQGGGGAAGCGVTLNPTSQTVGPGGGEFDLNVLANPGCAWTGTPTMGFITLLLAGSQSGNGTIRYRVEPNPAQGTRTGAMRVNTPASGFQDLAITQTGSSPLTASFVLRQDGFTDEGICRRLQGPVGQGQPAPPCLLDASASTPENQIAEYRWRTIQFKQGFEDESRDYSGKVAPLQLTCAGYDIDENPTGQEIFSVTLTIRSMGGQTVTLRRDNLQLLRMGCDQ
jgi:hypothetical protein